MDLYWSATPLSLSPKSRGDTLLATSQLYSPETCRGSASASSTHPTDPNAVLSFSCMTARLLLAGSSPASLIQWSESCPRLFITPRQTPSHAYGRATASRQLDRPREAITHYPCTGWLDGAASIGKNGCFERAPITHSPKQSFRRR